MLYYSRSYTVKDPLVPLDQMSTLRTFMRGVASDERNTAVLKKVNPEQSAVDRVPHFPRFSRSGSRYPNGSLPSRDPFPNLFAPCSISSFSIFSRFCTRFRQLFASEIAPVFPRNTAKNPHDTGFPHLRFRRKRAFHLCERQHSPFLSDTLKYRAAPEAALSA